MTCLDGLGEEIRSEGSVEDLWDHAVRLPDIEEYLKTTKVLLWFRGKWYSKRLEVFRESGVSMKYGVTTRAPKLDPRIWRSNMCHARRLNA